VCRGWRAFLGRPRLWEVLDFSRLALRTPALLAAAAAQSQGALRVLDVTGWVELFEEDEEDETALERALPVLRSNALSLLELRACSLSNGSWFSTEQVEELLAAAPLLRVLECDVDLDRRNEASRSSAAPAGRAAVRCCAPAQPRNRRLRHAARCASRGREAGAARLADAP
jgi:hypothetical protein